MTKMLPTRRVDDHKQWNGPITSICRTLNALDDLFRLAFTEGIEKPSSETSPCEKIKLHIYEDIRCELFVAPNSFKSLEALDKYFLNLRSDDYLTAFLAEFSARRSTRDMLDRHKLTRVISDRKLLVLKKLAALYHEMARIGYLLNQLNRYPGAEDCSDKVNFFFAEYQANAGLISSDTLLSRRQIFVDPLKVFNAHMIDVMREKKYGEIAVPDLIRLEHEATSTDSIYLPGARLLQALPAVTDIYAVVEQKAAAAHHQQGHTLEDYADGIRGICDFLKSQAGGIVAVSCHEQLDLMSQLKALREVEVKELANKDIDQFKQLFDKLKTCLPQLKVALTELEGHCDLQVGALKRLSKLNVWHAASERTAERINGIIIATDTVLSLYQPSLDKYDQALEGHRNLAMQLRPAEMFAIEWQRVNTQSFRMIADTLRLLQHVQQAVLVLSAVPASEFSGYLKRHWPEYTFSLVAGAGGSVGLTAWLFTVSALAPMVAVPVIGVSVLAAAGISKIRDAYSPPAASPAELACQSLQELVKANRPAEEPPPAPVPDPNPHENRSMWGWVPGFGLFGANAPADRSAATPEPLPKNNVL